MVSSVVLVCAMALQGGSAAVVPDNNRYVLKAENQPPIPIHRILSHPGLFNNLSKPIVLDCPFTRSLMQWLRWSTQKAGGKLRLDRISPGGRVIASYDLTSYFLSRLRFSDGISTQIRPILTLTGPTVAPVAKNADPQPTDPKVFILKGTQFQQSGPGPVKPMDWAILQLREVHVVGEPGKWQMSTMGGFLPGKSAPNPMPNSVAIRINLKCAGEPDQSMFLSAWKPKILKMQGTQAFTLKSEGFAYAAGEFPP